MSETKTLNETQAGEQASEAQPETQAGEPKPQLQPETQNETQNEGPEIELWTASAGGLSVTVDAFAITRGDEPRDPDNIWFLSMVGAQAALRAVWASLLNTPPKVVHLTPGSDSLALDGQYYNCAIPRLSSGTWKVRMTKMANGVGHHAITYTGMAEYSHDNEVFVLLARDGENEMEAHHRFLDRRITLPMHPSWAEWLWERGIEEKEIVPMECAGIRAWLCLPNPPKLEADVSMAVRRHLIGV